MLQLGSSKGRSVTVTDFQVKIEDSVSDFDGDSPCHGPDADILCSDPRGRAGSYIGGAPDGCECTNVVKNLCSRAYTQTRNWKRGTKVWGNCNRIQQFTAIATFPSGSYSGHAAIFDSCTSNGIKVWDQWCGRGKMDSRIIRVGNNYHYPSNAAEAFYTIEV
ncbi:uncharacterized protein LOC106168280 [Lingula anatina]|uniref:Uncharacterized protein LOC106168280 n=1 Tax=Lingula anatina TaxID=7574 RepID=A0A1S3IYW9_LINAN|nr:uncharacterized protein LOC106168280 [Lingula anatina]|eukprot:XP_013402744.1 uncharacterized protein LOC106168280 [Lingula anatina]